MDETEKKAQVEHLMSHLVQDPGVVDYYLEQVVAHFAAAAQLRSEGKDAVQELTVGLILAEVARILLTYPNTPPLEASIYPAVNDQLTELLKLQSSKHPRDLQA